VNGCVAQRTTASFVALASPDFATRLPATQTTASPYAARVLPNHLPRRLRVPPTATRVTSLIRPLAHPLHLIRIPVRAALPPSSCTSSLLSPVSRAPTSPVRPPGSTSTHHDTSSAARRAASRASTLPAPPRGCPPPSSIAGREMMETASEGRCDATRIRH
jgi:hypothetical protein